MFILPLFANSRVDLFLSIIKYDSKAISPIQLKKKNTAFFYMLKPFYAITFSRVTSSTINLIECVGYR